MLEKFLSDLNGGWALSQVCRRIVCLSVQKLSLLSLLVKDMACCHFVWASASHWWWWCYFIKSYSCDFYSAARRTISALSAGVGRTGEETSIVATLCWVPCVRCWLMLFTFWLTRSFIGSCCIASYWRTILWWFSWWLCIRYTQWRYIYTEHPWFWISDG